MILTQHLRYQTWGVACIRRCEPTKNQNKRRPTESTVDRDRTATGLRTGRAAVERRDDESERPEDRCFEDSLEGSWNCVRLPGRLGDDRTGHNAYYGWYA